MRDSGLIDSTFEATCEQSSHKDVGLHAHGEDASYAETPANAGQAVQSLVNASNRSAGSAFRLHDIETQGSASLPAKSERYAIDIPESPLGTEASYRCKKTTTCEGERPANAAAGASISKAEPQVSSDTPQLDDAPMLTELKKSGSDAKCATPASPRNDTPASLPLHPTRQR